MYYSFERLFLPLPGIQILLPVRHGTDGAIKEELKSSAMQDIYNIKTDT
jgi:hypothetical protein